MMDKFKSFAWTSLKVITLTLASPFILAGLIVAIMIESIQFGWYAGKSFFNAGR